MKIELSQPFFKERIAIMGIGLIGGSLALALKQNQSVGKIIAYDRNEEALERALALGVADEVYNDPIKAAENADIIVLATPITAMGAIVREIMPHLKPDAVLTDVGSTKGSVIDSIRAELGYLPERFVPAHPIAGTEKHGVENAFATLFEKRRTLVIPHLENSHDAVRTVHEMWVAAGSETEEMGVKHHDQVLAATSHIPHLLAYATVDTLANLDDRAEIFRFAAGGFRDFTRISASDPELWSDICLQNRESILEVLVAYQKKIDMLRHALEDEDREVLRTIFARAKHARDNFYKEPQ
ncbi:prephenate dehydrogenase/arogenate dehydrogenase family protein [Ignatzschineria ureiclastica]|uniref:prephenate dehydrogenase n=1 Tax=Ignatzschineria ureiclastica TaxID=472582 RepID=A0A2U2AHL5_9GAMM|nr:prephenate dehydrogenase/arogenate dehydrogenase family protein [Ignatzschineria ureiclastica]PWD82131.1 prephenate dehydrogenase/arogenate dehydrogenase family protein [Ignatzschineria ureiclastica]